MGTLLQPQPLPNPDLDWAIDYAGVTLIAQKEGRRLRAYQCIAGKWSNGWGETEGVYPGQIITPETADIWLLRSIAQCRDAVMQMCSQYPTPNQLAALVCLAYNIGADALRKSTVLRRHNASDFADAGRAIGLYNKYTNPKTKRLEVSHGLTARRAAEAALYLQLEPDDTPHAMPQAVASESSLAASPISASGVATAATGVLTTLSGMSDQVGSVVNQAKAFAELLGLHPGVLLGGGLVIFGAVQVFQRFKQRTGGWA